MYIRDWAIQVSWVNDVRSWVRGVRLWVRGVRSWVSDVRCVCFVVRADFHADHSTCLRASVVPSLVTLMKNNRDLVQCENRARMNVLSTQVSKTNSMRNYSSWWRNAGSSSNGQTDTNQRFVDTSFFKHINAKLLKLMKRCRELVQWKLDADQCFIDTTF